MDEKTKDFLTVIGRALADRQLEEASRYLAGWLPRSARKRFKQEILSKERQVRSDFSHIEIGEPDGFLIDDNPSSLKELREDGLELPPQIKEANFVRWCCLTLQADDEEWSLFDLWCAVVEEGDDYKIGFFEVHDPD